MTHLVELVGESASQVPHHLQEKHSDVPWQKIIGMRHRLVHGYHYVDYDILWETITGSLPGLVEKLNAILDEEA